MVRSSYHEKLPYPPEALIFVHKGLPYTVRQVHGDCSADQELVERWLAENDCDFARLEHLYEEGALPERIQEIVERAGGPAAFNRHVSGQELCWGLRDYALHRWGLMSQTVLRRWHIQKTMDFGNIVFALIEAGMLRKQPSDRIEDFEDVYDFDTAFECPETFSSEE
jgi:uncharacterized repeat protein (TIGR04138 family)